LSEAAFNDYLTPPSEKRTGTVQCVSGTSILRLFFRIGYPSVGLPFLLVEENTATANRVVLKIFRFFVVFYEYLL